MTLLHDHLLKVDALLDGRPPSAVREPMEALFLEALAAFDICQYNITMRHLNPATPQGVTWSIDGNLGIISPYIRKPFAFHGSPILRQSMVRRHENAILWGGPPEPEERRHLCPQELAFEDFFADHQYFIGASLSLPDLVEPSPWRITMGLRATPGVSRAIWEPAFRQNEWLIYEIALHFCHFLLGLPGYVAGMHYRHRAERAAAVQERGGLLAALQRRDNRRTELTKVANVYYLGRTVAPPLPVVVAVPAPPAPSAAAVIQRIVDDLAGSVRHHLPHYSRLDQLLSQVQQALMEGTSGGGASPQADPDRLPDHAPMLYMDRVNRDQSIVEFMRDAWMPWIRSGLLTRPDLRRLDPQAYMAMANWLRRNDWPADLPIPTKSETVTAELSDPARLREARRLLRAHRGRRKG
ncbi:hypothetical protein CHU95_01025 [Niveispirillum lacus]|uniref:Uncharacterized protein n=1 Tax=Niveispirillum lacus TaxID=1981099 RepID=A0A255Z7P0_9PROT|nr:hypothetical protein [Niveispirillum lacus]OYQ37567.1 hypothetical protein CHU95_01025 [Niveispirillum lacus]